MQTITGAMAGQGTLIASWRALAAVSPDAEVVISPVAVAAVFPKWTVLNNAIALDVSGGTTGAAVARGLSTLYRDAGVESWALWIPSPAKDFDAPDTLASVGTLARDTTTLVMQADLRADLGANPAVVRTSVAAANMAGDQPLVAADLPAPGPVTGIEGWAFVHDGMAVAGAWSCIHGRDCGIYAVGTVPNRRRRGFGRALVEHILADARRRGARTTTLQSTRMGQGLYESLGYLAVGRYEEWVST